MFLKIGSCEDKKALHKQEERRDRCPFRFFEPVPVPIYTTVILSAMKYSSVAVLMTVLMISQLLWSLEARSVPLAASSLPFRYPPRISNSRRRYHRSSLGNPRSDAVIFASKTKSAEKSLTASSSNPRDVAVPQVSYADLGPIGRVVAGTVEVTVTTVLEFLTGFCGGYFLGTVTDLPRLFFRSTAAAAEAQQQRTLLQEASRRLARMHGKSTRWAKSWGGISAAFGGFGVLVKVVRNGKEDEWNTVLSSMAAGAYFGRAGTSSSLSCCLEKKPTSGL